MKSSSFRLILSLAGALLASAQLSAGIINLSARGNIGADQRLVTGFVIAGDASKTVLVRGVGPSLADFGVTDAAAVVKLELYDSAGSLVAQNDGVLVDPAAAEIAAQVGAFPLSATGDSAVVATLAPGGYTVVVSSGGDGTAAGNALAEIYDADAPGTGGSVLVNASGRGALGSGDRILITGFVIGGEDSQRVLVRGVGRDLARYGLANPAAAVGLRIYNASGETVAVSDAFGVSDDTSALSRQMGAFPLTEDGGSEAVILLAPGAYTIVVEPNPANADSDLCLVEIYDGGVVAEPTIAPVPQN